MFIFLRIYIEIEEAIRGKPVDSAPKLYKQNSNSVPHLFIDQPERLSTKKWASLLVASPETYAGCELVSLTWAKALESNLSHEFVQFIVEDKRHGVRTRVFSDRQKKGETDNVIVGWDWSGENNPSEQNDMPLPLKSLVFNNNNRPSVVALAQVLATVTARASDYSFSRICFWYARSVFETAKAEWGGEVKE